MSFALYRKTVSCPNCKHVGKAKLKGGAGGWYFAALVFGIIGVLWFLPALIIASATFIIGLFKPAHQVCEACGFEHPVDVRYLKKRETS